MLNNTINLREYTRECIDAQKVYDYLLNTQQQNFEDVDFDADPNITGNWTTFRVLSCQVELVDFEELSDPENRPTIEYELPNGTTVTLQQVTIQKTVQVIADIEVDTTTGVEASTITSEELTLTPETLIMCAPTGTDIDVTLTDSSTCSVYALEKSGNDAVGNVNIIACQAIQAFAFVKLEVLAKFCEPRDKINVPICQTPVFPQQCPAIFPNNNNNDSNCGC